MVKFTNDVSRLMGGPSRSQDVSEADEPTAGEDYNHEGSCTSIDYATYNGHSISNLFIAHFY